MDNFDWSEVEKAARQLGRDHASPGVDQAKAQSQLQEFVGALTAHLTDPRGSTQATARDVDGAVSAILKGYERGSNDREGGEQSVPAPRGPGGEAGAPAQSDAAETPAPQDSGAGRGKPGGVAAFLKDLLQRMKEAVLGSPATTQAVAPGGAGQEPRAMGAADSWRSAASSNSEVPSAFAGLGQPAVPQQGAQSAEGSASAGRGAPTPLSPQVLWQAPAGATPPSTPTSPSHASTTTVPRVPAGQARASHR